MNAILPLLAILDQPLEIGVGVAAVVVLYFAFRATKFVLKLLLLLVALAAVGLAVWWFFIAARG